MIKKYSEMTEKEKEEYSKSMISKKDYRYYENDTYTLENVIRRKVIEEQKNHKITFDFVPTKQANRNVRSASLIKGGDYSVWQHIRNEVEDLKEGVCEVCQKNSFEMQEFDPKKEISCNTECHEIWRFEEVKQPYFHRKQVLVKLSPRCFVCHKISHLDQVKDAETKNKLINLYAKYNGKMSLDQAKREYDYAMERRKAYDDFKFYLDMSLIDKFLGFPYFDGLVDCHTKEFNDGLIGFNDDE